MIVCFLLFLATVAGCLLKGYSLVWALLVGLALFFGLGLTRGHSAGALCEMAWKKGRESLVVVPVFLLIGVVMGLWRSAGTISFFLYHGLRGVEPESFVLTAFVLTAMLSFALGTSFGVTGTAGVILITLARSGGVSIPVVAGAILSGAYFGDRCSPMSSCATLVAACTETELYRNVKEMLKTAALPTVLTLVFYAILSVKNPITTVDGAVLATLTEQFSLRWPVVLPAALMLVLPLCHVKVKWAMVLSALTAFILTVGMQGIPLGDALHTALLGYVPPEGPLSDILAGGGLISMAMSSAVVFITSLYAGILEEMNALAPVEALAERVSGKIGLFPTTAALSTLIVMVFCNQSVMVLMDEQLLRTSYEKRGASSTELAMDIANSGVTIAGLVPWSIALSVPLAMLDADLRAAPYAALLYLIPLCYLFTRRFFAPRQRKRDFAERKLEK